MWTLTCQSHVSILSYCPTWDIGRTSHGFPCVPLTCQSYVPILSYCPTWDIGRTSQGFPCVPLTCQSYVSILSYCPTWDIGRTSQGFPCVPFTCQSCVYPILLSHMGHTVGAKKTFPKLFTVHRSNGVHRSYRSPFLHRSSFASFASYIVHPSTGQFLVAKQV